ncbi:hypothetical protein ACLMJK_008890 [Lecanora helva]
MNLGDSRIQTVNVSQPQLVHSQSKQSIVASDDYYSLNSLTSSGSSSDDQVTVRHYKTPPMHMRSKDPSQDALHSETKDSEATIPPIRPVKHKDPPDEELAAGLANGQHKIKRKPVSSSSASDNTVLQRSIDEFSRVTPGIDDTPTIRFAIDQITRDEEVADHQPRANSPHHTPSEGAPYIPERAQRPQRQCPDPNWRRQDEPLADNESILLPAEPVANDFRHPKLNYKPCLLRLLPLCGLILCCVLMIAGLLFCALWPMSHDGLWQYDGVSTGRYFVFQYLPTILGGIIIIWLLTVQCAIHRIFSYLVLSSGSNKPNSGVLHDATMFPTNFMIPHLSFFRHGEPLLGVSSIIFWLSLFTVPLQSCLFQTRYYTSDAIWRWTTVTPVAWTLFALYLLLTFALIMVLIRITCRRTTGLKWDPVSLADIFVLFHRANFLSDFQRSEVDGRHSPYFSAKQLRLGYWQTSKHSDAFYGVGEENVPTQRYSLDRGKIVPVTDLSNVDLEAQRLERQTTLDTLRQDIHSPEMRYRWLPWFLRDGAVLAWILTAIALMIAFVVVSFVNRAVERGFDPQLPAPTTSQGFSPADFLYSFIPSFIGMVLFLLWQPIDMYFRALQPFANLAADGGCSAEESLLLDYTSQRPFEITFTAVINGNWKVAWISSISLMSITLPVLAGGVFTAQFVRSSQSVRIAADMPGYYALVVFVVIYALSFSVIWPGRRRELPHDISTVGQLVSFVYQSPLLTDAMFREPRSKTDLVTKLVGRLTGEKGFSKYGFGTFSGLDGAEHLGIARLGDSRPSTKLQMREGQYTRGLNK